MKIYHEIDPVTKLFVTDVFYEELKDETGKITNPVTPNMIAEPIMQSFHHPKWNGTKWVEGNPAGKARVEKERADEVKKEADEEKDHADMKSDTDETNAGLINRVKRLERMVERLTPKRPLPLKVHYTPN